MRKKISVEELEPGMFLDEVCGSWIDNPFWRSRRVISDPKEIALLRASNVSEVWIDVSKGADVWPATARAELLPLTDDGAPVSPTTRRGGSDPTPVPVSVSVSVSEEIARAVQICAAGKDAVTSMFREARMGNTVDAAGVADLVEEISSSVARNSSALISLARLKTADDYTYMHSVAVCAMMIALARQLKLPADVVRSVGVAGLLHDLGKMMLPIEVLNKPGKLTDAEFAVMKKHPELGHALLLETTTVSELALDVCLHHHEKIDGTGYPHRLHADAISLYAKMGAVCDVYDAITSNRPYKAGWNPAESIRRMAEWAKGHFDERVFHAFVKSVGIYPVGSLVRMASGHLGVVIAQNEASLTTPKVTLFFSTGSDMRIPPEIVDLSRKGEVDRITGPEDPDKWDFRDIDVIWAGDQARASPPKAA